ncbi:MAG TPA: class I SAM-dependent rRNA methyltransferase [Alphaproteobacteria bacterium]|jgi:23S rRNA (cytosine1962-C5)-methyltransferase
MSAQYPVIRLQPKRDQRARFGHPWVYSNEIAMTAEAKALPAGTPVRLEAPNGEPLGVGLFNPRSLIAIRMLSRDSATVVDRGFLAERLARALALRETLYDRPFYRLVHAEADGLPGLVIDRYGDVLSIQLNSAGMDLVQDALLGAIDDVLNPRSVVLRNDSMAREQEGLDRGVQVVKGELPSPLQLEENGAIFFADLAEGQKTGWFYDQRDNRAFMAKLAKGRSVLDVYSYAGGFAVQAALAGATEVTACDRSEQALALAQQSAEANKVANRFKTLRGEAFAELEKLQGGKTRFGIVVCDPPAFVKSQKDLATGAKGYRKIARLGASLVEPGGFLFVASCSHNMEPARFAEEVARGVGAAGRTGRIIRTAGAASDHPVHPSLPESAYLKAQVFQLD